MTILQIYCVQRIGPANPHWAIYYFKAIVHNSNYILTYICNLSPCRLTHDNEDEASEDDDDEGQEFGHCEDVLNPGRPSHTCHIDKYENT